MSKKPSEEKYYKQSDSRELTSPLLDDDKGDVMVEIDSTVSGDSGEEEFQYDKNILVTEANWRSIPTLNSREDFVYRRLSENITEVYVWYSKDKGGDDIGHISLAFGKTYVAIGQKKL